MLCTAAVFDNYGTVAEVAKCKLVLNIVTFRRKKYHYGLRYGVRLSLHQNLQVEVVAIIQMRTS